MEDSYKEIKRALEMATRISELKNYVENRKQALTYHDSALYTCRTADAKEYVMLDTISSLLYRISQDLDTRINPDALLSKIRDLF